MIKNYSLVIITLMLFLSLNIVSASFLNGEILVGFHDNITETEAETMVNSFDLTWESKFPELFGIWAEYKPEIKGEEGWSLRNQMAEKIVEEDKKLAKEPYTNYLVLNTGVVTHNDTQRILITFNIRATEEQAKEFISQFDGVMFVSFHYGPKWGIIKVPRGEEQKWIEIFEKKEIVRYAELNQVGTLSGTNYLLDRLSNIKYIFGVISIIIVITIVYIIRTRRK